MSATAARWEAFYNRVEPILCLFSAGVMRFSTSQYIYNLASKPLPDSFATYLLTVTIPSNGQTFTVQFGLRP
jgi:hypothetical protein